MGESVGLQRRVRSDLRYLVTSGGRLYKEWNGEGGRCPDFPLPRVAQGNSCARKELHHSARSQGRVPAISVKTSPGEHMLEFLDSSGNDSYS